MLCSFNYICNALVTLTSYSSILLVASWTDGKGAVLAVNELTLITTASNIIKKDWTSTSSKVSIAEANCICWHISIHLHYKVIIFQAVSMAILTLTGIFQLSTHHSSISASPGVITHSAPLIVRADLHSALIRNVTSCQSQVTIRTWSCMKKECVLVT